MGPICLPCTQQKSRDSFIYSMRGLFPSRVFLRVLVGSRGLFAFFGKKSPQIHTLQMWSVPQFPRFRHEIKTLPTMSPNWKCQRKWILLWWYDEIIYFYIVIILFTTVSVLSIKLNFDVKSIIVVVFTFFMFSNTFDFSIGLNLPLMWFTKWWYTKSIFEYKKLLISNDIIWHLNLLCASSMAHFHSFKSNGLCIELICFTNCTSF